MKKIITISTTAATGVLNAEAHCGGEHRGDQWPFPPVEWPLIGIALFFGLALAYCLWPEKEGAS